jgi:two-component system OmpR family response regulator
MIPVLMIDDDEGLAAPLKDYFARYDLELEHAIEPLAGIERLKHGHYAFLVLDIMLPGIDGFEVCRRVREFSDIPIIMLTARGEVTDRIVGLELGADDYLPKPFDPRELVARIQRILKRVSAVSTEQSESGLQIDERGQSVTRDGEALDLTTREFTLLLLLSSSPGKVWTRDQIMNALRGTDADFYSRVIDISISRLRKKLQPLDPITTVWGKGYRWTI